VNESERRVETAEPKEKLIRPSQEELIELSTPSSKTYTRPIGVEENRLSDVEEVEETEVTEDNYEEFLPEYTDDNPPNINLMALANGGDLVGDDGKLNETAQAEWDESPPKPQECFVDSNAGI
jgi:hypothetical protein